MKFDMGVHGRGDTVNNWRVVCAHRQPNESNRDESRAAAGGVELTLSAQVVKELTRMTYELS